MKTAQYCSSSGFISVKLGAYQRQLGMSLSTPS